MNISDSILTSQIQTRPARCTISLSRINDLLDVTVGYKRLSFLNSSLGTLEFHQTNRTKYTQIPPQTNTGATYQKFVNMVFKDKIGSTVEFYIDNMVEKLLVQASTLHDLQDIFDKLAKYNMRLNPIKCTFVLRLSKFLSNRMAKKGIKANHEQIQVTDEMPSPKTQKQVERLTRSLVVLRRFVSQYTNKFQPLFKILREVQRWSPESKDAFDQIKDYPQKPPGMTSPKTGISMQFLLVILEVAVSSVCLLILARNRSIS